MPFGNSATLAARNPYHKSNPNFQNNNNKNGNSNNNNKQQSQQLVNKRNAIKFGTDELFNLDAKKKHGEDEEDEEQVPKSQSYAQMKQVLERGKERRNLKRMQQQQQQQQNTIADDQKGKTNQRQPQTRFGNRSNGNAENSNNTVNSFGEQQEPFQQRKRTFHMPPEARLSRWTFVFKNLFPSFKNSTTSTSMKRIRKQNKQKTALLLEALERIDRWRRITATHGMMMKLRKIPAYIEATKPLLEAIQLDRKLQESREELWEKTLEAKENVGDEKEDETDDDDAESDNNNEEENVNASQKDDEEKEDENFEDDDDEDDDLVMTTIPSTANTNSLSSSALLLSSSPLNALLSDPNQQQLSASTLPMIYGSAISRAVFELTESARKYSDQLDQSQTFRERAQDINLPEELTEVRNQIAHGRMPTIAQLRFAASLGLQYLFDQHWKPRSDALKRYRDFVEKQKEGGSGANDDSNNSSKSNNNYTVDEEKPAGSHFSRILDRQDRIKRFEARRRERVEDGGNHQKQPANTAATAATTSSTGKKKPMLSLEELKAKMAAKK